MTEKNKIGLGRVEQIYYKGEPYTFKGYAISERDAATVLEALEQCLIDHKYTYSYDDELLGKAISILQGK